MVEFWCSEIVVFGAKRAKLPTMGSLSRVLVLTGAISMSDMRVTERLLAPPILRVCGESSYRVSTQCHTAPPVKSDHIWYDRGLGNYTPLANIQ